MALLLGAAITARYQEIRGRFGKVGEKREKIDLPVAEVGVVVDTPEREPEVVATAPETVPVVAPDTLEVAVDSPATELPPAMAGLAVAVAPVEAGQLAADGSFTLTLCRILVSKSTV